jgi:nucleotide-binding universal stress UspA family protein
MSVLVWVADAGWPDAVDAALSYSPSSAEIVLLHVTPGTTEPGPARLTRPAGSGRPPGPGRPHGSGAPGAPGGTGLPGAHRIAVGADADAMLAGAADRAGNRLVTVLRRVGNPEREVVAAGIGAELLVIARDDGGLSPMVRFVVEHATCPVLLVRRRR